MCRKFLTFFGFTIFTISLSAQVAMGKWRTHLAYNAADIIEQSENKVFAVNEGSLFSVDKRDGSLEKYSKVTGLNGTLISKIGYDETNGVLLIVYRDGNIDFMSSNGVHNLPDFYNKLMNVEKTVNHILFHENTAYLATNFGIITLNMLKKEIQDTYYIGDNASEVNVLNTAIQNGTIYAVTESTVYFASTSNQQLINFEVWSKMTSLPGNGNLQSMVSFGNNLILLRGGNLYKQDTNGVWTILDQNKSLTHLKVSDTYLEAFSNSNVYVFDNQLVMNPVTNLTNVKDGIYDNASSKFWFGGDTRGIAEYSLNGEPNFYKPEGPALNSTFKMRFAGNKLFVAPGGRWPAQYLIPGHIMIFEDNKWTNISHTTIEAVTNNVIQDIIDIAVDPNDNSHFFAISYSSGLYEFQNNQFVKYYNNTNSALIDAFGNGMGYLGSNLKYDESGNLWVVLDLMGVGVRVLKSDGNWAEFYSSAITSLPTVGDFIIDNTNPNRKLLFASRYNAGLGVFDDNGTIDNANDDKSIFISTFSYISNDKIATLKPENIHSIAQDQNGVFWLGTSEGPILINNPSEIFDSDFIATRVIIPRNDGSGLGDYLLEKEAITAIAIDGANRKWLGTKSSGVFLVSENGQETIQHFTTQNSPLLSNEIMTIAIHPTTGEVFFGTTSGLVSYQSDASEAQSAFQNVHVYPNPVRENFSGIITITGLVENTNLKITDVAGNLVAETTSNGSIATWDGKNRFGQKVSTGVYLAICVSPDGLQSATAKILIVN
ncbi:MAG: two-component regulator propeller domain-containing protein [Paludibacteraceae bacterium]